MDDWKLQPAHDLGLPVQQRLKSVRREPGLIESVLHLAWCMIVRAYLRVFHRLQTIGRENLPGKGPFILIANHNSHLDALVLATAVSWRLRDCVFPIAAGDTFFESPAARVWSAGVINALPMWRKKDGGHAAGAHAINDLRTRLIEDACGFILFPEGTRSRTGAISQFKPGIGMLVASTPVLVIPCHLHGTFAALPHDRGFPRPGRIRLTIGAPMVFADRGNDRDGWQSIAATLESAVRNLAGDKTASNDTAHPSADPHH